MNFMNKQFIMIKSSKYNQLRDKMEDVDEISLNTWHGFTILSSLNLKIEKYNNNNNISLLLFGDIIDPFKVTMNNLDIIKNIAKNVNELEVMTSIERNILKYSGRFVLFINVSNRIYALNDACGLRQLFIYEDIKFGKIFSSSPDQIFKFIGQTPKINFDTEKYISSERFLKSENQWFGFSWYDDRVKKLLPNYIYDESNNIYKRMNYHDFSAVTNEDALKICCEILQGSIEGIHERYEVWQPITGGYDSRVVLSASKRKKNTTKYYIFKRNNSKKNDIILADKIAKEMNLKFSIINTDNLNEEFKNLISKYYFYPRILPKTTNIQWHYNNNRDKNIVNISGSAGEIIRSYFPPIEKNENSEIDYLLSLTLYPDLFKEDIKKWYFETKEWTRDGNITVFDLFYWEQRMGHWGAYYPYEQDISIEEFTPFSNRYFLLLSLSRNVQLRKGPEYQFTKQIIKTLWGDLLKFEFNPIYGLDFSTRIKRKIKRNPKLYTIVKKIIRR